MALVIDKEGKYSKENWINNFNIVAEMITNLAGKISSEAKGANNGVASLDNNGKVVQTALNSEKLDGKTYAELLEPTTLDSDTNIKTIFQNGDYFLANAIDAAGFPSEFDKTKAAFISCRKVGTSAILQIKSESGFYSCFRAAGAAEYSNWIEN